MLAITNGKIYTMAGDIIENGTVLIEDGKISAVGKDIQIPENARVIDAKGLPVTPGLIDGHSHIGIGEEGIGFEGRDYNEVTDPTTPHLRAIDGIYPFDEGLKQAYQGGVTTVVTGPGSANSVGGTFAAIKTYGRRVEDMIVKDPCAMKIAFGENVKRVYKDRGPMTRMGNMAKLRELLYKTKEYLNKKSTADSDKQPPYDMKLEAMIPVLKKEIPLKAHAHRTDDIFTSIRLAKEFDVNLTLDHCTEGHLIADILGKEGYPAFVGPNMSNASKYELRNRSYETAAALSNAGVKVAIITDHSVIPEPLLPVCAGMAVKAGMDEYEALKSITINPAEICGIADRVGSLEKGKDADLVIWSKNPIRNIDAYVELCVLNGEVVFERE
ncbi:MAG: amidohydrolase [Eubacteriales bacterium]|nr:amidohydrolase [Eubacteriales bacterium]